MAQASLFGGLALSNAGLGAVHGLAGVIGGICAAPHGAICAVLLPRIMAANLAALRSRDPDNAALARYAKLASLLTDKGNAEAKDGVEWVKDLVFDLHIPTLGAFGLQAGQIGSLVEKSKSANSMKANPVVLTSEELAAVVTSAI
jgi:alcohol dehydrogenase class IV